MIDELSVVLEDRFDFSPLEELSKTAETLAESAGGIQYLPTNYPLPLSKRALGAVVGENENIRALPMPKSEEQLQDTIFAGLEYLVQHDGDASVVFFCPSRLVTEIPKQRGAGFVPIEEVAIEEPNHERVQIFEDLTGSSETDIGTDLASYLLEAYLTTITDDKPALEKLHTTSLSEDWDLYLPYSELSDVNPGLQEFFLEAIGIQNSQLYFSLSEDAQRTVFEVAFDERYGGTHTSADDSFLQAWKQQPREISELFRELAATRLTKGRLFNSRLLELTDQGGREFVEEVQAAYGELFGDEAHIDQTDPSDAADKLIHRFGILYHDASSEEIESLLAKVRSKLAEDSVHVDEYSPSKIPEILQRVDETLQRIKEVRIVTESPAVESALQSDSWIEPLEELYEAKLEHGVDSLLEVEFIPALEEAKRNVRLEREAEEEAEAIQDFPADLDELPDFLEQWSEYVRSSVEREQPNKVFQEAIVSKYEEFCDTVVSEYDKIRDERRYNHITDLLEPSDDLQLIVIIDSLGYTDIELMTRWGFLETNPTVEPLYSNIPSYTPSAMASLLTGLAAEETGIFNWAVRDGNTIDDLQKRHDPDSFSSIEESTGFSYYLLQDQDLMTSGITRFAQQVADAKLHDSFDKGDSLDDVQCNVVSEVNNILENRYDAYCGNDDIPEEHRQKKLEAQKSTFVVYLPDFDSLLHDDLALFEFQNYYSALGKFIDALAENLLELLATYKYEEDYELVFAGDHGKITRQERDLVDEVQTQERFHQNILTENTTLEQYYYLNFDVASFTDREGKTTLGVGDIADSILMERAREEIGDGAPGDAEIRKIIEQDAFVVSGSKFLYGWEPQGSDEMEFNRFGFDVHKPRGDGIFDVPTVGLLSRYQDKNTPRAHAYHGGTSISEMTAAKLTYTGDNDA